MTAARNREGRKLAGPCLLAAAVFSGGYGRRPVPTWRARTDYAPVGE